MVLTFHLAGINNQNFLMRDEQTGSYWQQVSGVAIAGPLKGKQLQPIPSDELTFSLFRSEHPDGLVLKDTPGDIAGYAKPGWNEEMRRDTPVLQYPAPGLTGRDIVIGVRIAGEDWAFPLELLRREKLILKNGAMVLLGPDGQSVRVFETRKPFYLSVDRWDLMDAPGGRHWTFRGCAADGECLKLMDAHQEYWFDWRHHHPATKIYRAERRAR